MGASCCTGKPANALSNQNRNINNRLQEDKLRAKSEVKLLLFGAGESGKSTLFKQMKKTYSAQKDFDLEYGVLREQMAGILTAAFLELVDAAAQINGLGSDDLNELHSKLQAEKDHTKDKAGGKRFSTNAYHIFTTLWACEPVQRTWSERWKYQVMDSLDYFMRPENLRRVCPPPPAYTGVMNKYNYTYDPTSEDVLRLRIRTSGIIKHTFKYNSVIVNVVDVGGQRNERKKWMEVLSDVTAVLFVIAMQEFDQTLFENNTVNRLNEAVELLQSTMNFPVFTNHSFILFFNKMDLFSAKVQRMYEANPRGNLDEYFPELGLGRTWELEPAKEQLKAAITKRFIDVGKNTGKDMKLFPHYVTAIDSEMFKTVFEAAAEVVLAKLIEGEQN
eukprot:augustus_masked-scaffold_5-processed-gene-18.1-mRNA-1 protein AED:0.19 eAED:0.51 QI:0/-1/0/1/-1/1/1/0/388